MNKQNGTGPAQDPKPNRRVITNGFISSGETTLTMADAKTGMPVVSLVNFVLIREPGGQETLFLMLQDAFKSFVEQGLQGVRKAELRRILQANQGTQKDQGTAPDLDPGQGG